MSNYVKPQTPLYSKENDAFFYPMTTVDQVIMEDGSRLNSKFMKPKAGFIYPLASHVVPEGFLLCDGKEYLRSEYPELFAAIGTMYGSGDGVSTFNVPNLQTRVPVGAGEGYELGDIGGAKNISLTENNLPQGTITFVSGKSGDWSVGYWNNWEQSADSWIARPLSQQSSYSKEYINNMQPYTVVNYIIATGKDTGVNVQDIIAGVQALPLGVEFGGTGATNKEDALNNLGAMSMELLWENASPTSEFVPQTVSVELNRYDSYMVVGRAVNNTETYFSTLVPVGKNTYLTFQSQYSLNKGSRMVIYKDSGLDFRVGILVNASSNTSSEVASWCIPTHIYGIKGVM